MKQQRTCGEALTALLEAYGVDTVFGIPGVHTIELYRGFKDANIQHITPRHEQGAGFMADGYARVKGKPGELSMAVLQPANKCKYPSCLNNTNPGLNYLNNGG